MLSLRSKAILGIDAAWTAVQPRGVALVVETDSGWRLVTAQPSYQRFIAFAEDHVPEPRPTGCLPDVPTLLAACERLLSGSVDLVAVDMPLSLQPITSRRTSDNHVSRTYGARHCSTHTPSARRPGQISDELRVAFGDAGYPLATSGLPEHALIEVYPHPALVELAKAEQRLPYKASKVGSYWPSLSVVDRKSRLFAEWRRIVALLDGRISGVAAALPALPASASTVELKAYEDHVVPAAVKHAARRCAVTCGHA